MLKKIYKALREEKYMSSVMPILLFCIFVFTVLLRWDTQFVNIGFLQLHSIDEYIFHNSLLHMYQSLISHKISGLFGFGFYQYGFIHFFLNLILTIPSFAGNNTTLSIIIPRIVTSLFAISSVAIAYAFAKIYLSRIQALFFAILLTTMPAFWYNATWFHPDWAMTFFLFLSTYLLAFDKWTFGKYFKWGIVAFALAVSFKYQAIMMIPAVVGYIFYDNIQQFTLKGSLDNMRRLAYSLMSIIGIFIVANPYILHPMGWTVFKVSFFENLASNANNHGAGGIITLSEKLSLAIGDYYLPAMLFIALMLIACWVLVDFWRKKERTIWPIIAINFLLSSVYLLVFVNKAWQIYYLPVIIVGSTLLIYPLAKLSDNYKRRTVFLITLVILQIFVYGSTYAQVLTTSRDATMPDFNDYSDAQNQQINEFALRALANKVRPDSNILITPYTPFEFERIGLHYDNVRIIFGALSADGFDKTAYLKSQHAFWKGQKTDEEILKSFFTIDYVIIRKNIPFVETSRIANVGDKASYQKAADTISRLRDGSLGYNVIAENAEVVIFGATQLKMHSPKSGTKTKTI